MSLLPTISHLFRPRYCTVPLQFLGDQGIQTMSHVYVPFSMHANSNDQSDENMSFQENVMSEDD